VVVRSRFVQRCVVGETPTTSVTMTWLIEWCVCVG
jgi:hypothetical protein